VLAALTMTVANLTALRQGNVVRLLGYSSVAHAGFILVPFAMAAAFDAGALGRPSSGRSPTCWCTPS